MSLSGLQGIDFTMSTQPLSWVYTQCFIFVQPVGLTEKKHPICSCIYTRDVDAGIFPAVRYCILTAGTPPPNSQLEYTHQPMAEADDGMFVFQQDHSSEAGLRIGFC